MAKPRKGVVPPQLRPYLFKKAGGGGGGKPSGRTVHVHVTPKSFIGKVKGGLAKLGGAGRIYYVVNAGKELQVVAKAQASIKYGWDEAKGQAALLLEEATGSKAEAIGMPILIVEGGAWLARKIGFSVPEWLVSR